MIQPSPTAPDGQVTTLSSYTPSDFPASAAVLCRNTAPLISFAFALLRRRVACRVLGREIGAGLIKLLTAQRADSLTELEQKLILARQRELRSAEKRASRSAMANITDKYDCLNVFIQEEKFGGEVPGWLDRLKSCIESLFAERENVLTLSTIHKAKGLEWPTVFILNRSLMPSPYAEQPWQLRQERNLHYVAITRAKLNLFYINSGTWTHHATPLTASTDSITSAETEASANSAEQSASSSNPPANS